MPKKLKARNERIGRGTNILYFESIRSSVEPLPGPFVGSSERLLWE